VFPIKPLQKGVDEREIEVSVIEIEVSVIEIKVQFSIKK
jgi:hypothetical protein